MIRIAAVVLLVASGACGGGGDQAPPCGAVAARFVELAKQAVADAKVDDKTSRSVIIQLPAMRDALVEVCKDGKWSAPTRKCLVHASNQSDFETCEQQLTDEQRRDLDRATRGESNSP